jgi:hypothetical protein
LGLIDKVLAPASTNKRQETILIEWHCQRLEQSRAHQPQQSTKGPSVDPAVFLFGWLASTPERLKRAKKGNVGIMGRGAGPIALA